MNGNVDNEGTKNRHDTREEARVTVMTVRKKFTSSYVKEESREERKDDNK